MKTVSEIVSLLAQTSARNQKIQILESNKDNELLKRAFVAALNPRIQYWVKNVPEKTHTLDNPESLEWGLDQLKFLSNRDYTGHAAIRHLDNIIQSLNEDDAFIIRMIVGNRDLRCGVSDKTVNKIWKKLIPEFPVMLCSPNDEKALAKMQYPAIVQKKEDGGRLITIVTREGVSFFSRNGTPLDLMDAQFVETLQSMWKVSEQDFVLDGELLYSLDNSTANRQTGNGIMNKAVRGTMSTDESRRLIYVVWDLIPHEDFQEGKSTIPYSTRFDRLNSLYVASGGPDIDHLEMVDSVEVPDLTAVEELFQQALEKGHEGVILKNPNGGFEHKRVKHQIKFKAEKTIDLRITDLQEGTGKHKGKLGAFKMESDDGKIVVSVGSGLSDKQREEYWNNPDLVLGHVGECQYNALIQKRGVSDVWSLFLPVFKVIRYDKSTTTTYEECI